MIHIFYANRLDALIVPLAQALRRQDPFQSPTIVVPNRPLERWLCFRLAEQMGIAVNFRFVRLESALLKAAEPEGTSVLTEPVLTMMMIRLLARVHDHPDPELASLKTYIEAADGSRSGMVPLARRLVAHFHEYAYSRREMIAAWQHDGWYFSRDHPSEVWQRHLWRGMFGAGGLVERSNAAHPKDRRIILGQVATTGKPAPFQPLYLFGIGNISRFHQDLLRRLSHHGEIHIFALNPCKVFWEDVSPIKDARFLAPAKTEEQPDWQRADFFWEENPFLREWGRPGRELFGLLNRLGNWDSNDCFVEPRAEARTLLGHVQADILYRRGVPKTPPLQKPDGSLRVLGCPSPRREAECLANAIWDMLRLDADLEFRDIAVIVTDMDTYQTEIEAAFHRIRQLPFNLIDGSSGRAARLVEAVFLLLQMADGPFQRESVFRLYQHPNFQVRFPEADIDVWLRLADKFAIFFGIDREDQKSRGLSYFDKDLFNWDQGFKRMLLGPFIDRESDPIFRDPAFEYLLYPMREDGGEDARLFYTVTQSLLADTRRLPQLRLSATDWASYLRGLVQAYLAPSPGEESDFEKIRTLADELSDLDRAFENPHHGIDFPTIRAFFENRLRTLRSYHGQYLADGVTVSAADPPRPLPFKVIFMMGLDEARFPRPGRGDTLDLRWVPHASRLPSGETGIQTRLPGDVSENEEGRYRFLETLMAADRRLILSFVDRDEGTGEAVNPSSVLAELLHWLKSYCSDFGIESHPLKNYAGSYRFRPGEPGFPFNSYDPFAESLARAPAGRKAGEALPSREATSTQATNENGARSWSNLILAEPSYQPPKMVHLTIDQLRRFLECPLQASAARLLRLQEHAPAEAEQNDEPLVLDFLESHILLHSSLKLLLTASDAPEEERARASLEEIVDQHARVYELEGKLPSGPLSGLAKRELTTTLTNWLEVVRGMELEGGADRFRLGRSTNPNSPPNLIDPIIFELENEDGPLTVRITGQTQYIFFQQATPCSVYFTTSKTNAKTIAARHLPRGFLDAVLLAAAGVFTELNTTVIGAGTESGPIVAYRLRSDEARVYLRRLVRQICRQTHDYLLPIEVVMSIANTVDPAEMQAVYQREIQNLVTQERPKCASAYGPLAQWRQRPHLPRVAPIIFDRFGLLFRCLGLAGWETWKEGENR